MTGCSEDEGYERTAITDEMTNGQTDKYFEEIAPGCLVMPERFKVVDRINASSCQTADLPKRLTK